VDGVDSQLVERVSALVQRREQRVGHVVLADAGRDPDVAERELGHVGVVGLVLAPALEVEPEALDDVEAEGELGGLGRVLAHAGVVGRRARGDGPHDRDQAGAQVGEQRLDGRGLHPVVGEVDQRIGDVVVAREAVRHASR